MKKLFLLMAIGFALSAQARLPSQAELQELFGRQRAEFPQEKIHVMTDREQYMGGDTIWFRAFMVDAATHKPIKMSRYIYVELKAPSDSLISRVKIRENDGIYAGHIAIPLEVIEADCTLSARTMYMEGMGEEYFFKKNIEIGSPFATKFTITTDFDYNKENGNLKITTHYLDKETGKPIDYKKWTCIKPNGKQETGISLKGNSITLSPEEQTKPYIYVAYDQYRKFINIPDFSNDFDITFHPEGGYMIPGTSNKIGFKAIDRFGTGISVSGVIYDSMQNEVAKFDDIHKGIGFFTLLPKEGETYTAVCSSTNGTEKSFTLPAVNPNATIIKADKRGDYINFYAESTDKQRIKGNRIVVHQRGILIADTTLNSDMKGIAINYKSIPDGIVNAVLFDNDGNPLSERLIFADNRNHTDKLISADQEEYATRQKVSLRLGDTTKLPARNFAISVTDNKSIDSIPNYDITSTLLLSSEIKGAIENPTYYFNGKNADANTALEALMLTQGWRRYDIPALVSGKINEPKGLLEAGEEISGTIRSKWTNKPEANASINVLVPKFRYANIFKSDSIGRFTLNGFEFPEETTFLISANNKKDKELFPNFKIDTPKYPEINNIIPDIPQLQTDNEPSWESFITQEGTRFKYNGLGVTLNEIVVTGFKVKPFEDFFQANALRTFDWSTMEKDGITEAEEVLRKISGLRISSEGYFTFRMEAVGLIIDGVPQSSILFTTLRHSRGSRLIGCRPTPYRLLESGYKNQRQRRGGSDVLHVRLL